MPYNRKLSEKLYTDPRKLNHWKLSIHENHLLSKQLSFYNWKSIGDWIPELQSFFLLVAKFDKFEHNYLLTGKLHSMEGQVNLNNFGGFKKWYNYGIELPIDFK